MIRSYGLHWHIDRVFWGRPSVSGRLLGSASRSPRAVPIDFREQRGIYALYAEYELVYVGQTGGAGQRLFKRIKDHRNDHLAERWDRFSWFGTQWVTQSRKMSQDTLSVHEDMSSALNILEAVSTAIAEPRLNLQRGRWGDAKQYFQQTDSESKAGGGSELGEDDEDSDE